MSFRALRLIRVFNGVNASRIRQNCLCTSVALPPKSEKKIKNIKSEQNLKLFGDPDTFGTLGPIRPHFDIDAEDEDDIREEKLTENLPLQSQKLTIKQYADIIKDFLKYKRLKEAIDVLEVRMLTVDRVKPENYIYNILIGGCAEVGYTKKALKLFNDMKRRGLKPTGDTYTCLFEACANSPWKADGLKNALHLRQLMIEKGAEPNLTNFNSMIKAFGRCGDLPTAFKIVDEMVSKKIKIRVHTFNHLLQASISDKNNGLRHALIVWRKMLISREKPNIYSFNLMLKCVKECDLGTKEDFEEVLSVVQSHLALLTTRANIMKDKKMLADKTLQLEPGEDRIDNANTEIKCKIIDDQLTNTKEVQNTDNDFVNENTLTIVKDQDITMELVDNYKTPVPIKKVRTTPNLLSVYVNLEKVLSLTNVNTVQDKFAIIGGQDDFLKEMEVYSVKPDIKTFTQMLLVADDNKEAELKLMETMNKSNILPDIDFYNMLIKKRCFRSDYEGAFEVKEMIEEEIKSRKKKFYLKNKKQLRVNIMTYGVLAMACKTKDQAEKLLKEMNEEQIKVNMEILGSLLRQGTANKNFEYIQHIMKVVKEENIKVNTIFLKHLEDFNDRCKQSINQKNIAKAFLNSYKKFSATYSKWLKEVNIEEALKSEHPWAQFQEPYPETIQRQNIQIQEPKRFSKRNRKYTKYVCRV